MEKYVRGVVALESPSSWPAEALKAQAVAARSYGLQPCPQRTAFPATTLYDVVDTTSCQVYGGADTETANANSAVAATAGQVLRYAGAVLRTEFSASNGGWTVGTGGAYVAKTDPYDAVGAEAARSTVHRWTGVRVPAGKIEQALGTGLLREVRVLARDGNGEWGGRVLRVRLVGDSRTVEVTGEQLRFAAGLRSSWFDLVFSAIDSKHAALGGDTGLLGPPIGSEVALPGGRFRPYRAGSIYWTAAAGAFEVHGAILDRWSTLAGRSAHSAIR
jgi:SpoIID/LytB domain protein